MPKAKMEERIKLDNLVVQLLFEHKGKEHAVSGKEIATLLRENSEKGYNYGSVTSFIRRIMIERRLPICHVNGMHGGYYWAKTKDELIESVKDLEGRIAPMQETIEHLQSFIF